MRDEAKQFLKNYGEFVDGVTSNESKSTAAFMGRIAELESAGADPARLLTAQAGLGAEAGEFGEVVKKIVFQGKPYNEDNIFHMKRELGDVLWYWMQGCIALNLDPVEVIEENIRKLESRFPSKEFNVWHSENRDANDL